jgi:hypothetical protein
MGLMVTYISIGLGVVTAYELISAYTFSLSTYPYIYPSCEAPLEGLGTLIESNGSIHTDSREG